MKEEEGIKKKANEYNQIDVWEMVRQNGGIRLMKRFSVIAFLFIVV